MPLPDGVKTVADRLSAARLNSYEDQVRREVLWIFSAGATPRIMTLEKQCGLPSVHVREILHRLSGMDLLLLDTTGEAVLAAYPFSATPTPHEVRLRNREVFALCAVDALGIPVMLQETATILSRCAYCGSPVEVQAQPKNLTRYLPADIVVWSPHNRRRWLLFSCPIPLPEHQLLLYRRPPRGMAAGERAARWSRTLPARSL